VTAESVVVLQRMLLGERGPARRRYFWYRQYSKIPPGLKVLLPDSGGKNSIHFDLSLLRGHRKANVVPPGIAGGAHEVD
jgi:hypothetical protein